MSIDWSALYRSLGDTADTVDTNPSLGRRDGSVATLGEVCVNRVNCVRRREGGGEEAPSSPVAAAFAALRQRCPDLVDGAAWQRIVEDSRRFLADWGAEAERLGWTADDIFGLPPVPERPAWNYSRLARLDQVGLIWLLRGRRVVALSADQAVIATPSEASIRSAGYPGSIQRGSITFYRRS
jgi:hypothetical protein